MWSPCKQGATSTTLHVFSFVAQQLSKIKLPSAFEKLTLCPPFRTHASSFSWPHPSINFTMFCNEKPISPLNWDIHGFGKLCPKGLDTLEIKCFCGALGSRCGEKVRDHVGQGYGKISQCLCTSVSYNAETRCPRASCEVRVFECELSTYLVRRNITLLE